MTETDPEVTDLDALLDKLTVLRREIRDEYLKPHSKPWIIGFSGGKDATFLAHFVIECILSVPPDERHRAVHIVSNDTNESPYDIKFTGTAIGPEISVEQPAATALVDGSSTINFGPSLLPSAPRSELTPLMRERILRMSSRNPMSSIRSTSSSTTNRTL